MNSDDSEHGNPYQNIAGQCVYRKIIFKTRILKTVTTNIFETGVL